MDMQDAWRAYLELALGVTEASRKRAEKVARDLLGRGEATAAQLQGAAEQLVAASRANRAGLVRLVRFEVERALNAVGLVTADEVAELSARLRDLERRLDERGDVPAVPVEAAGGPAVHPGASAAGSTSDRSTAKPAATPVTKKAVAKKAVATKQPPGDATAKKPAARKATAQEATAQKATAQRAAPAKAAGKRAATRKATGQVVDPGAGGGTG
jgi:polyhydroxyalkanoate synthesis regulator phasin